jgi:hypothetical protein
VRIFALDSDVQSQLDTLCEYRVFDNGIHEFIIKGSSREHADAFMSHLDHIYATHTGSNATVRMLSENKQGILPMSYIMSQIKRLMEKYPNTAPTRAAIILPDSPMTSILDTFIRLLRVRQNKVRYYKPQQREAAIEWLLRND